MTRKNKINLTDYPYKRDIENRLALAQLNIFEVNVLKEILHHSLKISIDHLADILEVDHDTLQAALGKLSKTKLFKIDRGTLIVDKETRKYYESQIEKFDEDFEPNTEFLQSLLSKVPIHALPDWYAIPRGSDNIIASIIEKYLLTPEIYRLYLQELQFDHPHLKAIVKDLYASPEYKISSAELIDKYRFSREQFEEYILLLEYHLVCCIRYEVVGDKWEEVISPFQEWLDFLLFEKKMHLQPILDDNKIKKIFHTDDFGFIRDMHSLLQGCRSKKKDVKELQTLLNRNQNYLAHLIAKLEQLEYISEHDQCYAITKMGENWLAKSRPEQSVTLANHPLYHLQSMTVPSVLSAPRNFRLIGSDLVRRVLVHQWVFIDDFVDSFIAPIGNRPGISLKNKGKKWKYVLPSYSEEEKEFIRVIIIERFAELGYVNLGIYKDKICMALTPFGKATLH